MKLDEVVYAAYRDRKKGQPLLIYADELNNFFRSSRKATQGITTVITSGGERSVSFLGGAQRPRWIGVESIESLTRLYWFYTPFREDVRHLKDMGVPSHARPPENYYEFYFYDRNRRIDGRAKINLGDVK